MVGPAGIEPATLNFEGGFDDISLDFFPCLLLPKPGVLYGPQRLSLALPTFTEFYCFLPGVLGIFTGIIPGHCPRTYHSTKAKGGVNRTRCPNSMFRFTRSTG